MGRANMIAIILENNEEYVSPVFAIRQAGWRSEVLAFNKERTHLRRIKIWRPRRQVFIVDWEKFACKKFAREGYDWVLQDKKLWKAVCFGKKAALFAVVWAFVGVLILFLTNFQKGGVLVAVLFFALCLVTIIFPLCFLITGKEKRYIITPTTIYYFNGNVSNLSLNLSQIKDIKLYRSLIKRGIGTIKIK